MDRPFVLSNENGLLWLKEGDDEHGILFPFNDIQLPDSVTASVLQSSEEQLRSLKAHIVYQVSSPKSISAFRIRLPEKESTMFHSFPCLRSVCSCAALCLFLLPWLPSLHP